MQPRISRAKDRRIVLVHETERSHMILACATTMTSKLIVRMTTSPSTRKIPAALFFTVEAEPEKRIHLTKYMVYHTSKTADADEIARRAEWTLDRVTSQGFTRLLADQEQYLDQFWRRSDVQVSNIKARRAMLSTVEMQQAIRFNLFISFRPLPGLKAAALLPRV